MDGKIGVTKCNLPLKLYIIAIRLTNVITVHSSDQIILIKLIGVITVYSFDLGRPGAVR